MITIVGVIICMFGSDDVENTTTLENMKRFISYTSVYVPVIIVSSLSNGQIHNITIPSDYKLITGFPKHIGLAIAMNSIEQLIKRTCF